jgi:hypothetical protein
VGFDLDEMDLLEWMERNHVEPGGDCSGFFEARDAKP